MTGLRRQSGKLLEAARGDVCSLLATRADGLTSAEAASRLPAKAGSGRKRGVMAGLLRHALANPLVVLLAALSTISFATGDVRAGSLMAAMIVLSVGLRLIQETRAGRAEARLREMITVNATVLRDGVPVELPFSQLVPGDVVRLAAGDMVPADVRLISARDLFVVQAALTGESLPVEKFAGPPLDCVALQGTSISSGSATAVVVATGQDTYLGGMAESLAEARPETAFDRGISRFTWVMLRLLLVMVPLVFLLNGLTKHDWTQAFFFALAVAVGLTPEMLPMIVTVCLSKGALAMGKKKVIVKRLDAIQNLGAMDVLCADKTGTLTLDRVILERHCDVALREDDEVLRLAWANSHFQTGLHSVLDRAVLQHAEACDTGLCKVDEIPFDFERRIMSVIVKSLDNRHVMISKGAPEAIFPRCVSFELDGKRLPMDHLHLDELKEEYERLSADGFRVLAIAVREVEPRASYGKPDEHELVLRGYVAFLDPPKETAAAAIRALEDHGVAVKIVTGDNHLVARKICKEVGLAADSMLLGDEIEKLSDEALAEAADHTTLFARVSPAHKERIIRALQARRHTVGFMGDGINDAPALHTADVGISVDSAVDIAKDAADLVLLERSLLVLDDGVMEGRKVFSNILKYVRMGASSNFGNMLSVVGASLFVPFLPMLPIQILTNNLLYDLSQAAIPTDAVDAAEIARPRPWELKRLLRFILLVGPCSSLFDYTTFFILLYGFGCWTNPRLFQTGWFVESLLSQTLIIHVIRTNKIPLLQSRASQALTATTLAIMAIGIVIAVSPLGRALAFVPLPRLYWPILAGTLAVYLSLTQVSKMLLVRRGWI